MGFELLQKSINKPQEDNLHTSSSKDTGQTLPSSFHRHKWDTEAHTHSLFGYNPRRKDNSLSKYTMFWNREFPLSQIKINSEFSLNLLPKQILHLHGCGSLSKVYTAPHPMRPGIGSTTVTILTVFGVSFSFKKSYLCVFFLKSSQFCLLRMSSVGYLNTIFKHFTT